MQKVVKVVIRTVKSSYSQKVVEVVIRTILALNVNTRIQIIRLQIYSLVNKVLK